ncbi:response regulator [Halomonas salifodinae]|uniref:response regulator n=1 Tax=Halomonas salifodinae TaxID=438745 RepID=UPI0033AE384F
MRLDSGKGVLWKRLVWPALWPCLAAEAGLVLLCLLAWLMVWRAEADLGLLMLTVGALLLGTALVLVTFLLLFQRRLHQWELGFEAPCDQLEHLLRSVYSSLPSRLKSQRLLPARDPDEGIESRLHGLLDTLQRLLERLSQRPQLEAMLESLAHPAFLAHEGTLLEVNRPLEQLLGRPRSALEGLELGYVLRHAEGAETDLRVRLPLAKEGWHEFRLIRLEDGQGFSLGLLEDLDEQRHSLAQLTQARDRARQEASLQAGYLQQLQQELVPLLETLEGYRAELGEEGRALESRLQGLADLLASLVDGSLPPPEATPSPMEPRPQVLIVDDGPVNVMLARQVLEGEGLKVVTASGGEEALALQREQRFDLVLMDIYMPAPDGLESSRRWREHEARRGETPSVLVALTANASEADRQGFREAGMDDYLAKPYRPHSLIELVRRWLPASVREQGS